MDSPTSQRLQHNGRPTTIFLLAATITVVGLGAVVLKRPLLRQWYEWRFQDENLKNRHQVAKYLVNLGGEETVSTWLRERFQRGDEASRSATAEEAVSLGLRALANDLFLADLETDSSERQEAALGWLQDHGNTETARKLLSRLHSLVETPGLREQDVVSNDQAISHAYVVVSAIAKREKANSVPLLLDMIEAPTVRPGDSYQARICAVYILSSLKPDADTTLPRLNALLGDEDEAFRTAVEQAINSIGRQRPRRPNARAPVPG